MVIASARKYICALQEASLYRLPLSHWKYDLYCITSLDISAAAVTLHSDDITSNTTIK